MEGSPTVADLMRTDVPVLSPEDTVATAARLLADSGLPGAPVVENGEIVGIVTENDLIAREAELDLPAPAAFLDAIVSADAGRDFEEDLRRVLAVNVRQLMSHPVYNIRESASLYDLATLMLVKNVNPVPVVDENTRLVGIVARSDIVRAIARLESAGPSESRDESPSDS